jgi:hypothetical protein
LERDFQWRDFMLPKGWIEVMGDGIGPLTLPVNAQLIVSVRPGAAGAATTLQLAGGQTLETSESASDILQRIANSQQSS